MSNLIFTRINIRFQHLIILYQHISATGWRKFVFKESAFLLNLKSNLMKNTLKNMIIILMGIVFFIACKEDDPENNANDSELKFLLLNYSENNKLETGAYISLLEMKKGEPEITPLAEIYPIYPLSGHVEIENNRVVMGLHSDFNTDGKSRRYVGIWFDVLSTTWEELPLLPSGSESRYSYFDYNTGKVSKSGYIFYLSSSNDISYNDQYRAGLVRYNPETDELTTAISPVSFTLGQPEKGWDTETGIFGLQLFPSNDGRYVYGYIRAFGVDGGSYHYDYEILFKYDFQLEKYTRLGDSSDKHVKIYGINSSKTELFYSSIIDGIYEMRSVNIETNSVKTLTTKGSENRSNTCFWNSNGFCAGQSNNIIAVYDLINDSKHEIRTPSTPYSAQFSPNGEKIYYMTMSSVGNYLCKTSDTSTTATIDTICAISTSVQEFLIVK